MTVKRITDPAGILPDRVIIKNDSAGIDKDTFIKMLMASTPQARIAQLTRHKALEDIATHLKSKLIDGNANLMLLMEISDAEKKALYLDVAPRVISANNMQLVRKRPRKSRMPLLDAWLFKQDLSKTAHHLFHMLPDSYGDSELYRDNVRDGNLANRKIVELDENGKPYSIGFKAFQDRVTRAKKRIPHSH